MALSAKLWAKEVSPPEVEEFLNPMITHCRWGAIHHSEKAPSQIQPDGLVGQGSGFRSQKETTPW